MTNQEPDTLAELIEDCTELPAELRPAPASLPEGRTAAPWEVDEGCYQQVADLEVYV
ncbi:hypothetical protein [Saccharothrix coeruleofusca]|uniref:Uncharacterized protein n=1 Tax=Saccharothrix coeruleofusca TaxID=33919 RepID=A0A918AIM4_9PSEU|nr:hypothetical protein [Saccharothrix coeruleofusca]MBP2334376.1 hypothetical protein [Saccharothrix coeruleofusca]GGP41469.1 hypothetical protein GCM10010185_10820 [Saccharothrix coeruleofusca]